MHLARIVRVIPALPPLIACSQPSLIPCSYSLLNFMRKPFNGVYDPGMDKAGRAASAMDPPRECEVIQRPSAKQFLSYVEKNRPFVIRGEGKRWKAYKRWNKRYLLNKIGDSTVRYTCSLSCIVQTGLTQVCLF